MYTITLNHNIIITNKYADTIVEELTLHRS